VGSLRGPRKKRIDFLRELCALYGSTVFFFHRQTAFRLPGFGYNDRVRPNPAALGPLERGVRPLATGEVSTSSTQNIPQLPHHKVKIKKAGQRACNEKNEKGKFCGGHLKLWSYRTDAVERECGDVEKAWGPNAEVYRCEHCKTLYLPAPAEERINVAGQGMISVFGLTLPPKEKAPSS
jgi:hypothetical protein